MAVKFDPAIYVDNYFIGRCLCDSFRADHKTKCVEHKFKSNVYGPNPWMKRTASFKPTKSFKQTNKIIVSSNERTKLSVKMQRIESNKMCDKHVKIPFEMQSKNQEEKETDISSKQETEKCIKATTHRNKEHGKR